jgi:plasmid stabilization system protein ParE
VNRFTVTWTQNALDQLAELWIGTTDREALTRAGNRIDEELAVDPHDKGAGLHEGLRSLERPPLRVIYEVVQGDRVVEISAVRRIN